MNAYFLIPLFNYSVENKIEKQEWMKMLEMKFLFRMMANIIFMTGPGGNVCLVVEVDLKTDRGRERCRGCTQRAPQSII